MMSVAILRKLFLVLVFLIVPSCGFSPLHNYPNSMDIFKNISIKSENNFIAFLIEESLEEKAPFEEGSEITLHIKPTIKK